MTEMKCSNLSLCAMARPGQNFIQLRQFLFSSLALGLIFAQFCTCSVIRSYKDLRAVRTPRPTRREHDNSLDQHFTDPQQIPVRAFNYKMHHLRSYRDIVRIFYGDYLPDRTVDEMLSKRPVGRILPWQEMLFDDSHIEDQIQAMEKAQEHWDEMTYSPHTACAPKPECVQIAAINRMAHLRYFPACTVIYKCNQSPCACAESQKCVPRQTDLVTRHFIVVRYVPDQDAVEPQTGPYVKSLTFENHTRCECSDTRPLHRCRRCPYPFILTRDAPSCECGCHHSNTACRNIRDGRRPIPEDSLTCIKNGPCANPSCEFGMFTQDHLKRGYCPTQAEMQALSGWDDYDGGWNEQSTNTYQ